MIKYRVYICKVGEEDRFIDVKTPEEGLQIVLDNVGGYRIEDVGIQEIDTELENDWDEWFFEHDGLAWDCGSLDLVDGKIKVKEFKSLGGLK